MASVDPVRIADFKRLLAGEKDLAKITYYFLDHFGDDPEFHDACEIADAPEALSEAIEKVIAAIFGGKVRKVELRAVQSLVLSDSRIIHGSIVANRKAGLFVWVEDLEMGIVTVAGSDGDLSLFARVTVTPQVA